MFVLNELVRSVKPQKYIHQDDVIFRYTIRLIDQSMSLTDIMPFLTYYTFLDSRGIEHRRLNNVK